MNISFDISPLNPDNVVDYLLTNEHGYEIAYIAYRDDGAPMPKAWTHRIVVKAPESDYYICDKCGFRHASPLIDRCRACGNPLGFSATAAATKEEKPKFGFKQYTKENAKDSLVRIGGRDCLILGTTEAVTPKEPKALHDVILLSFYHTAASENLKHEVLQFCYYCTATGELFEDKLLKELNDTLWRETTQHFFRIVPKWNVVKISEIYQKRSV